MIKLKQYAMMTVKAGIGLIPKSVREQLKKNPAMEAFYSRALQRSGLFYGFPSRKKLNALYRNTLQQQHNYLISQSDTESVAVDIVIFPGSVKQISETIDSLKGQLQKTDRVFVLRERVNKDKSDNQVIWLSCWSQLMSNLLERPVVLLEAGDLVHTDALKHLVSASNKAPVSYCDTDEIINDKRENPRLLPDWNPDLQLSTGYIATGVTINKPEHTLSVVKSVSSRFDSVSEFVAALYLADQDSDIDHIPLSLIAHRPDTSRSTASLAKIGTWLSARNVAVEHDGHYGLNTYQWPLSANPLVSLIIPTKNAHDLVRDCITSIIDKTRYENYEILLVDNNSDDPASLEYFDEIAKHPKVRLLKYPHPFNYSAINNFAAGLATGEIIGLINNDVEVISPQWLSHMVGHTLRDDIGCVGAKLLYSDGRIQHAGVVMGYGGGAGHAHKYFPRHHPGYLNRLVATHNFSAVTAACLLVKRKHFETVGGLNEQQLQVAFNDVDFCLKVRELGVRNLYCAEAELFHHESVSRGLDSTKEKRARFVAELEYLQTKWRGVIDHDPAYNPHLTLRRENFSIKQAEEY